MATRLSRTAALVAAEKRPVSAADGNIKVGPLDGSVVDLQVAVLEKTRQRLPLIECVADRLCAGTFRQNDITDFEQILAQLSNPNFGGKLAWDT